jgi:8-oxo-dGTP pyrophosphatase MutT (NUDIX family)
MAYVRHGNYLVVLLPVGSLNGTDIEFVMQREPRTGQIWFHPDTVLPSEEPVDVAVRELLEETGLTPTADDLTLLCGEDVRAITRQHDAECLCVRCLRTYTLRYQSYAHAI